MPPQAHCFWEDYRSWQTSRDGGTLWQSKKPKTGLSIRKFSQDGQISPSCVSFSKPGSRLNLPALFFPNLNAPLSLRGWRSQPKQSFPLCHCKERDSSLTLGTGSAISPPCLCEADFSQPKQSRGGGAMRLPRPDCIGTRNDTGGCYPTLQTYKVSLIYLN